MAGSTEILKHTADIRLKARGETFSDLLDSSLEGMNRLLLPGFEKKGRKITVKQQVHVESGDRTSLLVDFISEILTLSYMYKSIFFKLSIDHITEREVTAIVEGTKVDGFEEDIKAVTYHEADVSKNASDEWETIIIFDI